MNIHATSPVPGGSAAASSATSIFGDGGPAGPLAGSDAFAALFARLRSTALKPSSDGTDPGTLSQLESLLGGMLQQPPAALTTLFDRVQSALGAPPTAGTHASVSSIAARIDTLLASGTTRAQVETTVSQALTQAFAELSTPSSGSLDRAFVTRLQAEIASALSATSVPQGAVAQGAGPQGTGPPGAGPPGNGPPAAQAAALAGRIANIGVAIVAGADSGETGQQFRYLASTLDPSGRGLPAPQTQTAGEASPTVVSSSLSSPATARAPVLPSQSLGGAPVRIDPQLATLVSTLALARDGDRQQPRSRITAAAGATSSGSWLEALAAGSGAGGSSGATPTGSAPAQQSQPYDPVDPYQVMGQVVRSFAVRPADGTTTLRLHLVPDSLGDVSVKLVVGPNGVSASFTAATPAAGAALQQGAHELGRTFADQGLQLQQFSVNVGGDSQGGFAYRQPPSFVTPFTRYAGASGTLDDEDSLAAIPSFGPSTAVRPQGYLDYLV